MKKNWQKIAKTLAWTGATVLAGLLLLSATRTKSGSKVAYTDIYIQALLEGEYLVNEEDVQRTIAAAFEDTLGGKPIETVDVAKLERVLTRDPFLRTAEVHLNSQNVLEIKLTQREPVLRVMDASGLNYYLDEFGTRMPTSPRHTARVLVATGELPPHDPDFLEDEDDMLAQTFRLAEHIRRDELWRSLFEQIDVKNGRFTLVPKVGDQTVLFGKLDDVEDKFARLRAFYEKGMGEAGWRKFAAIDLRYEGQVIGRR